MLVQASVSNLVMEVFPRPRGWVPAPPDTLANSRSPKTILSLTDRRERQWEKNPAGILGGSSDDPQTLEPAQLHGVGSGRHSGRPLCQGNPQRAKTEKPAAAQVGELSNVERGATRPGRKDLTHPGRQDVASGEPHGLAEKISLTREGRMWQGKPRSSTRVNRVSRGPGTSQRGPSYLRPDAVSALRDVSTFQPLFLGIFVSRIPSIQMLRFSRPCHLSEVTVCVYFSKFYTTHTRIRDRVLP